MLAAWADRHPAYSRAGNLSLPRSVRALKGYGKMDPSMTRDPLPWELLCLIALQACLDYGPLFGLNLVVMFLL